MESDSGHGTGSSGVTDDTEPVDGGKAPSSVVTYEINDEGKLVNQETGEEYTPGPDTPVLKETMPQELVRQHYAPPPQVVEP